MMKKSIGENVSRLKECKELSTYINAIIILICVITAEVTTYVCCRHSIMLNNERMSAGDDQPLMIWLVLLDVYSCLFLVLDIIGVVLFFVGWRRLGKGLNDESHSRPVRKSMVCLIISITVYLTTIIFGISAFVLFPEDWADSGITRRLPPPIEESDDQTVIKERNIMEVSVLGDSVLLINGSPSDLSLLKDEAVRFMTPRPDDETAPEVEAKHFDLVGDVLVSKGIISVQTSRNTSYAMYVSAQNELAAAFTELQEKMAREKFHKSLNQLTEEETKAIKEAVPVSVSEAEPIDMEQ